MTALETSDGDGGDWVELVDFARMNGADVVELWRRAFFGAVVGNLDDHLRNHGFLRRGSAWTLAPVFDVNPTPRPDGDEHEVGLFGAYRVTASALLAADARELFGVAEGDAWSFVDATRRALRALPRGASDHGADARSVDIMRDRVDPDVLPRD